MPEQLLSQKGGALRLFFQSLGAGYGARISHTGTYGQSVNLRYSLGGVYLVGSVGLELGQVEHAYRVDTRQERWLGGDFRLTRPRGMGPLDVFAGVAWRGISQVVQRQSDSRLTGAVAETSRDFFGLAAGGVAGVSWSMPLAPDWSLLMEGGATLLAAKEGGELVLRPEGALELGFVTRF